MQPKKMKRNFWSKIAKALNAVLDNDLVTPG